MTLAAFYLALDIGPIWQERDGPPPARLQASPSPLAQTKASRPRSLSHRTEIIDAPEPHSLEIHPNRTAPATRLKTISVVKSDFVATLASEPLVSITPLIQLAQKVSTCQLCDLSQTRTKTVFGKGVEKPHWLVIGAGPGYSEDLAGEPFIGRAGQLLEQALRAAQLDLQKNVYLTHALKCRPVEAGQNGKDRHPSDSELAACRPYLETQIALLAPRLIFALGANVARALLPLPKVENTDAAATIDTLREQNFHYGKIPVVVSYHPADLLIAPLNKKLLWHDLCRARALVDPSVA